MNAVEEEISDRDLMVRGFRMLVEAFGDVNAERFITLNLREPQDYTKWRAANMYVGEDLHAVAERARASGVRLRAKYGIGDSPLSVAESGPTPYGS